VFFDKPEILGFWEGEVWAAPCGNDNYSNWSATNHVWKNQGTNNYVPKNTTNLNKLVVPRQL
jgi:hypothetical protein